jgi:Mg-chelatase subunit ChlD
VEIDIDIVLIIDRSGSMARIKNDAEGAINYFIESQKALPGKAVISAVQFDNRYEHLFGPVDIDEAPLVSISPAGPTALLDAIGRTVVNYVPRYGNTVYVIITDGEENASAEWNLDQVKALIEECENHGDKFVFLAANQDAIKSGAKMGFSRGNSITYTADSAGVDGMGRAMVSYMTQTRSGLKAEFSDEDRANATGLTVED